MTDVTPEEIEAHALAKRIVCQDVEAYAIVRGKGYAILGHVLDPEQVALGYSSLAEARSLPFYVQAAGAGGFHAALRAQDLDGEIGERVPDFPALLAWIGTLRAKQLHRANLRKKRLKLRGLKIRRLTVQLAAITEEHGYKIDVTPHRRGAAITVHLGTHGARLIVRLDQADEVLRGLPALLDLLRAAPARGLVELSLDTRRK